MSTAFESQSLADRVIIVTGASSGIGRAAARLFSQRGATVVAADVNDDLGATLIGEIITSGGRAAYVHADISDEADVEAMVGFAVSEFGGLHGAFNNAGIISKGAPLEAMPLDDWRRVVDINLTGTFLCMKHEIAHMAKHGGGSIVNTSSGSGVVGSPNMPDYVASKHGVVGLTRAAAIDYSAKGIRTNAIAPGAIETPMLAGTLASDPLIRQMLEKGHPIGHMGQPINIAEAAAWLLSDASAFVTGICLCVDGGYTAM